MTPFQSQRTTDLQAEYATNESDLATLLPELATLKAKANKSAPDRSELLARQLMIDGIRGRQAELADEIAAAVAADNSEANLQKRAKAFADIDKVHLVSPDVLTIHAQRMDAAFTDLLAKVTHRANAGYTLSCMLSDAVAALAPGDLQAVHNNVHALPLLRGSSRGEAKALAYWIRKLIRASGCEDAIGDYLTFSGGLSNTDRLTFTDVATQNAGEVTAHLEQVLAANGIDAAPTPEPTQFATPADFIKSLKSAP
jgi:hypothetical protein